MHNLVSATKFFHVVIILIMIFGDVLYWRLLKKLKIDWTCFCMLLNMALQACWQLLKGILPEFFFQVVEYEIGALFLLAYYVFTKQRFS